MYECINEKLFTMRTIKN